LLKGTHRRCLKAFWTKQLLYSYPFSGSRPDFSNFFLLKFKENPLTLTEHSGHRLYSTQTYRQSDRQAHSRGLHSPFTSIDPCHSHSSIHAIHIRRSMPFTSVDLCHSFAFHIRRSMPFIRHSPHSISLADCIEHSLMIF
jgi:hypothetical protein